MTIDRPTERTSLRLTAPEDALAIIPREAVSSAGVEIPEPETELATLVVYVEETGADLSSLAYVGGGGAPRAPAQVKRLAQSFAKALPNTGWGITETNAIGTGIAGQDYLDHPGSFRSAARASFAAIGTARTPTSRPSSTAGSRPATSPI